MACQLPPLDQVSWDQKLITTTELVTYAAGDIATQLGIGLIIGGEITPLAPFIWGATVAALAIEEILNLFGGGRPKFEDTNNVIWAYNMSAYWPLHALAADMQIWENNGAPISDSNPAVQATFSAAKLGTIESIQQMTGWPPGEGSPGFWQLQQLINTSWAYSKNGQQAVLRVVEAIDCFTEFLYALKAKQPPGPPPPPPGGPPPPPPPEVTGCDSGNLNQDEILDFCQATQNNLNQILAAIQGLQGATSTSGIDPCCQVVANSIMNCAHRLAVIGQALLFPKNPLDLGPLTTELTALVAAVNAYPPVAEAVGNALAGKLGDIATAIASLQMPAGTDVSGIVAELKRRNDDLQVPADWKTQLINSGAVPLELEPLLQSTTWETIEASAAHLIGYLLGVGLSDAVAIVDRIFGLIIKPFAGAIWKTLTDIAAGFNLGAGDAPNQIANAAKTIVKGLDTAITTLFGGAAGAVLEAYESGIAGIDTTTDAGVSRVIQILMGRALELGMGAHLMATLPELAYFTKQLGLNATAALLAELAGFHEIMIQAHRPFMTAVLGRPATYTTNRKYPNTLPGAPIGMTWFARRKLSNGDATYLASSAGFNPTWQAPMLAAAYRPVSPRALATAIQDTPFPKDEMRAILEDNGFADEHVAFMLQVLEYNSTKNVRNAYVTEAIAAYKAGVMPDTELDDILNSVGWSDTAKQFVRSRALLQRRVTLAAEAEKNIIPEVASGGMTPDVGLQQLEAAGIEPWYAQLQITLAETKASIHALKLAEAEARRTLLAEQRNLTRAAVAEFQRGVIDLTGLTAALAAIGLDPTLVASIVAVQEATRTGRMRLLYDQLLSPQDARLLEERVAAIGQQTKDQLITLDQAAAQLKTLGVGQADVHALIARWAATLKKSPGAAQLISPP